MQTIHAFLCKCETYYLATSENGQPRVRPFGTADLFEGRIYIMTGKHKEISKQLRSNPLVELCAYDGETWVRIRAEAVEDDRRSAKAHMLETYPFLRSSYSEDDGNMQVLYLKNAEAVFETFGGEKRTVEF